MKTVDIPQLALMRAGIDYKFEVSIRSFKVTLRPLTNLEIIQATSQAVAEYSKLPENQRVSISASLYSAMYQLEKASAPDVGDYPTLPLTTLQMMNPNEVNHLWKQYVNITEKVNPSFEEMTIEQLDAIVADLKKNSDPRSTLTDLSISNVNETLLYLLKLLRD